MLNDEGAMRGELGATNLTAEEAIASRCENLTLTNPKVFLRAPEGGGASCMGKLTAEPPKLEFVANRDAGWREGVVRIFKFCPPGTS